MYYLALAVFVWALGFRFIDWSRIRDLVVYGLYAAFVTQVQDHLGMKLGLWEYRDTGIIADHRAISMVISLSAAPLFGMYFAQGLKPGAPVPWLRIAAITAVAMIPELVGQATGHFVSRGWWNPFVSVAAYVLLWWSFWRLHRFLTEKTPTR